MASIVRRIVELAHDHGARAIARIRKFARSRPHWHSAPAKKI